MAGTIADGTDGEHHRNLDQHADHCGERRSGTWPEQRNRSGNREFEEVTGADQGSWCCYGIFHPKQSHQAVGETGIEVDLDQDRDCDQRDVEEFAGNIIGLETEYQNQRCQQRAHAGGCESGQQFILKPLAAAPGDEVPAQCDTSDKGDHDKYDYRIEQHVEWDFQRRRPADEKPDNRSEQEEHNQIVHRYLDQGVGRIASGEMAPYENHCRAWRRGQDDAAGDVLGRFVRRDQAGEEIAEEDPCDQRHGERLHHPVDEECDEKAAGTAADVTDGGEVDLHHHGDDH